MYNFLFHLLAALFLEITVGNFQNFVFAEDGENEADDQEGQGKEGEENANDEDGAANKARDTKDHVRSIVDSLLKINKHVDSTKSNVKTPRLLKEQGIDKQIDNLRKDLDRLGKTLDRHYGGAEQHAGKNVSQDLSKKEEVKKPQSGHSKPKKTHRQTNGYKKYSPFLSDRIYTVKNVRLPRNATNRYISHSSAEPYRIKYYGKKSYGIDDKKIEYKIKSFAEKNRIKIDGAHKTAKENSPSDKLTIKSKSYFSNRPKCASTGCAG